MRGVEVLVVLPRVVTVELFGFPAIYREKIRAGVACPEWLKELLEGGMDTRFPIQLTIPSVPGRTTYQLGSILTNHDSFVTEGGVQWLRRPFPRKMTGIRWYSQGFSRRPTSLVDRLHGWLVQPYSGESCASMFWCGWLQVNRAVNPPPPHLRSKMHFAGDVARDVYYRMLKE